MNTITNDMFSINEHEIKEIATNLIDQKSRVVIDNQQSLENATDLASIIKKRLDKFEKERKSIVKPFNDGVKNINLKYKTEVSGMVNCLAELKQMILSYTVDQERLAKIKRDKLIAEQEAQAIADAEKIAESGETEIAESIIEKAVTSSNITKHVDVNTKTYGNYGSSSTSKLRRYRVKDLRDIPVRFLQLDDAEIKKFLASEKANALLTAVENNLKGDAKAAYLKEVAENLSIKGIEFYFVDSLSIK